MIRPIRGGHDKAGLHNVNAQENISSPAQFVRQHSGNDLNMQKEIAYNNYE